MSRGREGRRTVLVRAATVFGLVVLGWLVVSLAWTEEGLTSLKLRANQVLVELSDDGSPLVDETLRLPAIYPGDGDGDTVCRVQCGHLTDDLVRETIEKNPEGTVHVRRWTLGESKAFSVHCAMWCVETDVVGATVTENGAIVMAPLLVDNDHERRERERVRIDVNAIAPVEPKERGFLAVIMTADTAHTAIYLREALRSAQSFDAKCDMGNSSLIICVPGVHFINPALAKLYGEFGAVLRTAEKLTDGQLKDINVLSAHGAYHNKLVGMDQPETQTHEWTLLIDTDTIAIKDVVGEFRALLEKEPDANLACRLSGTKQGLQWRELFAAAGLFQGEFDDFPHEFRLMRDKKHDLHPFTCNGGVLFVRRDVVHLLRQRIVSCLEQLNDKLPRGVEATPQLCLTVIVYRYPGWLKYLELPFSMNAQTNMPTTDIRVEKQLDLLCRDNVVVMHNSDHAVDPTFMEPIELGHDKMMDHLSNETCPALFDELIAMRRALPSERVPRMRVCKHNCDDKSIVCSCESLAKRALHDEMHVFCDCRPELASAIGFRGLRGDLCTRHIGATTGGVLNILDQCVESTE